MNKQIIKQRLLGPAASLGYRPTTLSAPLWYYTNLVGFTLTDIEYMRRDYQLTLGLQFLKSPLYTAEFAVKSKNAEVAQYAKSQLKAFWRPNITKVLRAVEYGYSGGELLYRLNSEGKIVIKGYKEFHPRDIRALTWGHEYQGMRVKQIEGIGDVDLFPPKSFWFAANSEFQGHYGRSYLLNVWDSWYEKKGRDGAIEIRKLWFYKNAFSGGIIRHPHKDYVMPDGTVYSAREMAREQGEKLKTGGVVVFPSSRDEQGQYQWVWEPPTFHGNAQELLEYPAALDNEILRGLRIPDSVVTDPAGTGSYAGRRVPERAFYVGLESLLSEIVYAFKEQVLDHLIYLNFEGNYEYEIETKPLIEIAMPEGSPPAGFDPNAAPAGMDGATVGSIFSTPSDQVTPPVSANLSLNARAANLVLPGFSNEYDTAVGVYRFSLLHNNLKGMLQTYPLRDLRVYRKAFENRLRRFGYRDLEEAWQETNKLKTVDPRTIRAVSELVRHAA